MAISVDQLAAIEEIRDVAHRYSRGIDRLDADTMRSAYWPDAIDNHGVFVGNAWEFVDRCMASHARWKSTMHCLLNHWIEIGADGHTAKGEIYNVTYLIPKDAAEGEPEQPISMWLGRYVDRYELRAWEGELRWRIADRVCVHEATRLLAGSPMPIPAHLFVQGSADR